MIKVLFLAANPAGTTPLALDEEIRAVDAMIRGSEHRDRLHLVSHWAVRLEDLSGLLMRQRPDVVHFSGHGADTGDICLVGGDGTPSTVPQAALAGLFRVLKDNVRVVVFNACHSEAQAKAVAKVIDCAVGMSRTIDDDHAIAFAAEFYQALGYGKSVRDAYELGVVRLIGQGVPDARKLVKLHKRRAIDPTAVVLVGTGPGATSPEPPAPAPDPDVEMFAQLERDMPDVLDKLGAVLSEHPFLLDIVAMKKSTYAYNFPDNHHGLFENEMPGVLGKLRFLADHRLLEVTKPDFSYRIRPRLANYLRKTRKPPG